MCFFLEKHRLSIDIDKDSANSGIEFKRFCSRDNKNDIIVNDFTSVTKTEVNFERKTLQANNFWTNQVINECAIFDIVDLTGFMYNVQSVVTHEKDGKTLRISKKVVKDQTRSMEIVLFSSVIDEVSNNTCYDFKKNENAEIHRRTCLEASGKQNCIRKWKCQDISKWW